MKPRDLTVAAPNPFAVSRRAHLAAVIIPLFIASCSTNTSGSGIFHSKNDQWSGRLSLRTLGEPPENWVASFVLQGGAQSGKLTLLSPLGSTLAEARWSPALAELDRGNSTQVFPDLNALTTALTGSALPVAALFSWLNGLAVSAEGWTPQLDDLARGRLQARRDLPAPAAEIRIILDRTTD